MIDAVSTVSVQSTALRISSQGAAPVATVAPSAPSDYIVWRVRIDDQSNRLLLETVSTAGQVVSQWPSAAQLEAFSDAAALAGQVASAQAAQIQQQQLAVESGQGASSSPQLGSGSSYSFPSQESAPVTPTPQTSSAGSVPTTTVIYGSNAGPSTSSSGSSTQSVVA